MKFGDYIRQKREKNAWTQPEAAARIDIEQSYLSKLETGKSYPSEEVFEKLVKTYAIDINHMGRGVFSGELDKLREIAAVRTVVLGRQQSELKTLRSWLVASLAMLMLGSGLLAYENTKEPDENVFYSYQSPGVIKKDEPIDVFTEGFDAETGKTKNILSHRIDFDILETGDNMGPEFIKKVEGGQRRYQKFDETIKEVSNRNAIFVALGFALMIGGIASFFIARRWR
jgi:transcriptional regulator with XRE-family HTH domain